MRKSKVCAKNNVRKITCVGDDYKVGQLRQMLKDIDYDNNPNWSHAILKSGSTKGINLDARAIELLIDYYTNTYVPIDESTKVSRRSRSIKASTTNPGIIDVLEANGFESAGIDEPWWDKYMWLGFGCTYDADLNDAYVWWNPDGNMVELPYAYPVKTVQDAKGLCDELYAWDEYGLDDLLAAGLPLKGANKIDTNVYEYSDGGETAYIDIDNYNGYIIDAYGDRTDYSSLQDLLEEIGIIR